MLDIDYPQNFARLMQQTDWAITLPEDWDSFFAESGVVNQPFGEQRHSQRRIVRARGLMTIDEPLPAIARQPEMIGIYTRDFSKDSCGLITPIELYPEEKMRLILPTFWLTVRVVRCRRHNAHCYEVGAELLRRHDADRRAFVIDGRLAVQSP